MSRLTHTFLMVTLCLAFSSSAIARQSDSGSAFPSTLHQAIDHSAPQGTTSAPWRAATAKKPAAPEHSPIVRIRKTVERRTDAASNAARSTQRQTGSNVYRSKVAKQATELPTELPTAEIEITTPAPLPKPEVDSQGQASTTPTSAPVQSEEPKPARISLTDTYNNLPENSAQNEFGTVMMFPAVDRLTDDASVAQQPKSLNQNVNRVPGTDASSFRLSSFPIPRTDNATLRQPATSIVDRERMPPTQILRTTVIGPEMLIQDTPDLFEIEVTNTSNQTASNIIVQMGVSEDLTITNFDRKAWLDEENRTVSWQLAELAGGAKEIIRFRAVSASPGQHEQQISVGMENSFQGQTGFVAFVIPNPESEARQSPEFEK